MNYEYVIGVLCLMLLPFPSQIRFQVTILIDNLA